MKLAHIAIATPRKCGLYETTRELVAAERALGVDARIVDPKPVPALYPGNEDRGVPLADMDWAVGADVIVSHSGHDGTPVADTDQPIIHVAHGRPYHSWLGERDGGTPVYSYNLARAKLDRYKCCVTFWPEHKPYWELLWGDKPVHAIPAPVDVDYWCPGETNYDFAGKAGEYNVVMTDPWCRNDMTPFHCIHAFALFRKMVPGAKLHLYAVDKKSARGLKPLLDMLGDGVGVVQGWAADLRSVYRAADMLITPHSILTRSVREAAAVGCTVVSPHEDGEVKDVRDMANIMCGQSRIKENSPRWFIKQNHHPAVAAREFLSIAAEHAGLTVG